MAIAIKSVTTNVNTGSSATIAVTTSETPSTTAIGDRVIVIHADDFYTLANMPTPTATGSPTLTGITNGAADGGTDQAHIKSYSYLANTAGAQTISVTETGAADEEKYLVAYVLSGVDTSTPIDVAGNTSSATGADPWVLAAISPTSSDAFLIAHVNRGGAGGLATIAIPGSMTLRYNQNATAPNAAGATEQLTASGTTGTRTFDPNQATPWAGVLIAIKTDAGGPPPTPPLFVRPLQGRRWR